MSDKLYTNTIKVYDKLGERYLKDTSQIPPQMRREFIKEMRKGAYILDAGCGGGRDTKVFANAGLKAAGIDLSKVLISIAKKQVPQAKFKVMDLLKLNFPPNTFDGIWAQASLLHLKRNDVKKVLKSFYKILKPQGLMHVRVKLGKGEGLDKQNITGIESGERFFTYFSKKEVEKFLKDTGFKIGYSRIHPDELGRKVKWIIIWGKK